MIKIDEDDPVGELEPSFPYRDVKIQRGVDVKEFYDLQAEIGRGKFGTVYKCREKSTGLYLAAKFVSTGRKEDKRNVEREIDIMRSLQHPRLIQLYDAFEKDKTTIVVLELIEGGELFERVIDDDFILTERSCTVFMRQICEGMEFIHRQNILHLDMKPENILCLTKTGNRIKIIDFGLARKYDPDKKLQVLFGTPEFVAPEVVNFDQIGFGTDMWSIGVICYVLLSGLSPFMGETDIETMANVTISKWDFDDDAFFEISDDAKDFISNLLVKDKEKRLTASQCLSHPWLRRNLPMPSKKQPSSVILNQHPSDLDLAKDNLKIFVERWNEHPNSPYLFDTSYQTISPCVSFHSMTGLRNRTPSSSGCSPSPCGSISSLADSTNLDSPLGSPNLKSPMSDVNANVSCRTPCLSPKFPYLDRLHYFDRRASDSSCFVRNSSEFGNRINLAEEIKKLSDKLLKINRLQMKHNSHGGSREDLDFQSESASGSTFGNGGSTASDADKMGNNSKIEFKNFNSFYYSTVTTSSTNYGSVSHRSSIDFGVPRRKFKFSTMNRDVPLSPLVKNSEAAQRSEKPPAEIPSRHQLFGEIAPGVAKTRNLKENLLSFLDKFEKEKCFSLGSDSVHRKSLSVELSES